MMKINKFLTILASCLLGVGSGLAHAVINPSLYPSGENPLPVSIKLCSEVYTAMDVSATTAVDAEIKGEAGAGLKEVASILGVLNMTAQIDAELGVATAGDFKISTCYNMTEGSEFDFDSDSDRQNYKALLSNVFDPDSVIDINVIGVNLLKHATSMSIAPQQSVAAATAMNTTIKAFEGLLTDPQTATNPFLVLKQIDTIAQQLSGVFPAQLNIYLRNLDQVLVNHLGNIDVIKTSCKDINRGKVEYLDEQFISALSTVCGEVDKFFGDGLDIVKQLKRSEKITKKVFRDINRVQKELNKLKAVGEKISKTIGGTIDAVDSVVSDVENTIDSIGLNSEALTVAIDTAEDVVEVSLGVLTDTAGEVKNVSDSVAGGISDVTSFIDGSIGPAISAYDTAKGVVLDPLKLLMVIPCEAASTVKDLPIVGFDIGLDDFCETLGLD